MSTPQALDPIRLEIVHNALRSVADEAYIALMKSAYSTNIKERHDHSAALLDARGRLVVQTERTIPMHLGSMLGLLDSIRRKYDLAEIHPGDIFAGNDPYLAGGTHLPDVNLAMPVFLEGRLVAFACNVAHHADIGGMSPGSMDGNMSEIFQEGLRIPIVKLVRRGEFDRDVFDLLLTNVRIPRERRGDYHAQIAACRLAERRLLELNRRYSADLLEDAFDEIITRTEARIRRAIRGLPKGRFIIEDFMDDDGLGTVDIPMRLAVEVGEESIRADFTGTAAQVRGNINSPLSATVAAVAYAVKALLDPDAPNNEGVLNVIDVVAEDASLVRAAFPAALANRQQTCQRIADMVILALAEPLPEAVVGGSHGATVMAFFSGTDVRTKEPYIYLEVIAGGAGGRFAKDGKDGVQVHTTNTSNLPVEAIEMEYPLFVESYGLIPDSGGPGRQSGGLGLRRVIRPLDETCVFAGHAERFRHRPPGVHGGGPGRPGRYQLEDAAGARRDLPAKAAGVPLGPGMRVIVESPVAGGYGVPNERRTENLLADYESGKCTRAHLIEAYGFDPEGVAGDD